MEDVQGPAQLTVTDALKTKLDMYLRKACDPLDDHDRYLSMPEGQQVTNVSRLLNNLSKRYDLPAPTATKLRKDVATKAALECSSGDIKLLSKQMSHSIETHKEYYERIGTKDHAAKAFKVAQRIMQPEKRRDIIV